jgi:Uma2 family endonuclease
VKFGHYRKVESLIEYLLVSQRDYRIEQYVRQAEGPWSRSEIRGSNAKLDLTSIECSLDYAEIYERVNVLSQNH